MADTNPIIPITGILTPALMTGYIAESKYIKGGYVVVKDIKERDDLLSTNLYESREAIVEGSLVYVVEENKSYRFIGGSWQEDTDAEVSNLKAEVEEIKKSLDDKVTTSTLEENYYTKNQIDEELNTATNQISGLEARVVAAEELLTTKVNEVDTTFEETAPPTMFEVGNLQKGSSVAGMSVKDILKKILYGTFYPTFTDPSIKAILSKTYQGIVGQNLEVSGTIAYDPGAIMLDGKKQNNRAGKALYYRVGEDLQKDVGDDPSNNYSFTYTFNSLKEGGNKATVILHYAEGPQPLDSDGNASGNPLVEGDLTAEIVVTGVALTYTDPKLEVTIDPTTGTAGKELAVSGRITYTPGTASLNGKVQGNSTGDITKCTVGGQEVAIKAGENALDYNYTFSSLAEGNNNLEIIIEYAEGPEALYRKESGSLTKILVVVGEAEPVSDSFITGTIDAEGNLVPSTVETVIVAESEAKDLNRQGPIKNSEGTTIGYQITHKRSASTSTDQAIVVLLPQQISEVLKWDITSQKWAGTTTGVLDVFEFKGAYEYNNTTYYKYAAEIQNGKYVATNKTVSNDQYRFMIGD